MFKLFIVHCALQHDSYAIYRKQTAHIKADSDEQSDGFREEF